MLCRGNAEKISISTTTTVAGNVRYSARTDKCVPHLGVLSIEHNTSHDVPEHVKKP